MMFRKFSMLVPETNAVLEKFPERKQVLLVGMETQVCILQTCLDLIEKNYDVYLLVDGITSIRSWERKVALKRLEKEGAILTTYESAVFDLLKDSKDEKFKEILAILKQTKRENAINHL